VPYFIKSHSKGLNETFCFKIIDEYAINELIFVILLLIDEDFEKNLFVLLILKLVVLNCRMTLF